MSSDSVALHVTVEGVPLADIAGCSPLLACSPPSDDGSPPSFPLPLQEWTTMRGLAPGASCNVSFPGPVSALEEAWALPLTWRCAVTFEPRDLAFVVPRRGEGSVFAGHTVARAAPASWLRSVVVPLVRAARAGGVEAFAVFVSVLVLLSFAHWVALKGLPLGGAAGKGSKSAAPSMGGARAGRAALLSEVPSSTSSAESDPRALLLLPRSRSAGSFSGTLDDEDDRGGDG